MRQLSSMLKHIDRRLHNEYVGQAALQGVKLPFKGEGEKVEGAPLTADEEALMMKSLEAAKMRTKRG